MKRLTLMIIDLILLGVAFLGADLLWREYIDIPIGMYCLIYLIVPLTFLFVGQFKEIQEKVELVNLKMT